MTFGEFIKLERNKHGVQAKFVAEALRISQSQYSRLENGGKLYAVLTDEQFLSISHSINVPINVIYAFAYRLPRVVAEKIQAEYLKED